MTRQERIENATKKIQELEEEVQRLEEKWQEMWERDKDASVKFELIGERLKQEVYAARNYDARGSEPEEGYLKSFLDMTEVSQAAVEWLNAMKERKQVANMKNEKKSELKILKKALAEYMQAYETIETTATEIDGML